MNKRRRNNGGSRTRPKPVSRKERRKEQRKQKKVNKHNFFSKKKESKPKKGPHGRPDDLKTYGNKIHNSSTKQNENGKSWKDGSNKKSRAKDPISERKSHQDQIHRKLQGANRKLQHQPLPPNPTHEDITKRNEIDKNRKNVSTKKNKIKDPISERKLIHDKMHLKLQEEMKQNRNLQLLEANEEDEKLIKTLEKRLNLSKRKSKSAPKLFTDDGLDYLLDVCDQEKLKNLPNIEQVSDDSDSEFEEDLAVSIGKQKRQVGETSENNDYSNDEDDSDQSCDMDIDSDTEYKNTKSSKTVQFSDKMEVKAHVFENGNIDSDIKSKNIKNSKKVHFSDEAEVKSYVPENTNTTKNKKNEVLGKRKRESNLAPSNKRSKIVSESMIDDSNEAGRFVRPPADDDSDSETESKSSDSEAVDENSSTWEDIYGRTRDKDGNVIGRNSGAYVPPALRTQQSSLSGQARQRLQRQNKGLLNRLTESNLASIVTSMEQLYSANSRHDMNETLTSLILESLITPVLSVERLVMEHALLVACLHSKVGSDVGAFFLQTVVEKFDSLYHQNPEVENKELDNIILILCYLYDFKVFHSKLILDVLQRLCDRFGPKDLELVLIILRISGFGLRKDEPAQLKTLMIQLQQNGVAQAQKHNESRVKFMLDILLAVKNNNVARLPGYDPEPVERLRKVLRAMLLGGSKSPELNISLQDLLDVDKRGRWWVVGSAWAGQVPGGTQPSAQAKPSGPSYSAELLELARQQRMNTDVRRNIFCILMTAHDYQEAFENLLQLGLKGQQAREVVHVSLDCCLQEAKFNKYYCHILQNFCDYDRMYRMTLQFTLWDKFREINDLTSTQSNNLGQLILHLIVQGGLTLTVFKVVDMAEIGKPMMRMMRQVLLGLLTGDREACEKAVTRIKPTTQNRVLCSALRVFLQKFVVSRVHSNDPQHASIQNQVEYFDNLLIKI